MDHHVRPEVANTYPSGNLKTKPFFSKNPAHDDLYTDQPLIVSEVERDNFDALREELLANEIPALTFAAGHRGVGEIRDKYEVRDVDIRDKFLIKKNDAPWPRSKKQYEWRHSDIYVVAYPYLSGLYDEWVERIEEGVAP